MCVYTHPYIFKNQIHAIVKSNIVTDQVNSSMIAHIFIRFVF